MSSTERLRNWRGPMPETGGDPRPQELSLRENDTHTEIKLTHGDCHAHQFFLESNSGQWQVTVVVDMEVASAGDCG